jgi:RNA polymerase sigma factor (sigma-70 family)
MQPAILPSVEPPKKQDDLESLGFSGATLMQLWGIGVSSISDLTGHNTDSLRARLIESLNGSTQAHARIEKAIADIHAVLKNRRITLKQEESVKTQAQYATRRPATTEVSSFRSDAGLDLPDYDTLDKANAGVPRLERDPLEQFYKDMKRYKRILPREEQFELGRRIAEEKDMVARDTLVLHNLRLVLWVARKQLWATFARKKEWSALEFADLVQEGVIGLMIAAEKFDYRHGFAFSTYAHWWIRQAITRAIMDSGFVRIPVHMGELLMKVRRAMNEIALREGRAPTLREVATAVESTPGKVKSALRVSRMQLSSLDDLLPSKHGDGEDTVHELIADETALRADHVLEAREELDAACARLNELTEALYTDDSISERDKSVFVRIYGLDGSLQRRTLEHVSESLEITRERVRQILEKLWDRLQLSGVDMDHESVLEELVRIAELEKLAGKRVSSS